MSRIVVLHFSPLELYPPIQNFLRGLSASNTSKEIYVLTTQTKLGALPKFTSDSEKIKIIRLGISAQKLNSFRRYSSYLFFYLGSIIFLLWKRPSAVLYYETISSYPAYLYKRFFNSKARIFIHYHEYTSTEEYSNGMKLNRYFHKHEKYLYPMAEWVSQTNEYRMQKFIKNLSSVTVANPRILPNYPPANWHSLPDKKNSTPIKAVYIGALSLDTMYVKEFSEWIMAQNGEIILDIYSYNIADTAKSFLRSLQSEWIILKEEVGYERLPQLLKQYEVGVVLYKGHIDNYIFNAPNKLFEYLTIGLDVWFPNVMKGTLPYITDKTYPKVIAVDFMQLEKFYIEEAIDKEGYTMSNNSYYSEQAFEPIITALLINYN